MELNHEQAAAANHVIGEAALLLAGAGSGKTECLTHRVVNLIEQGIFPKRILVLTFTNKAADEIRRRVLKRTGLSEDNAPILTTIHSLCLRFIRRNPQAFGLASKVSPIDEYDQKQLIKTLIERENAALDKAKLPRLDINFLNLQEKIEYHRARGVGFAKNYTPEVHAAAKRAYGGYHALNEEELALWEAFEKEKAATSVLDFSDMIAFVNRRIVEDPDWAARVQNMFDQVLQDESQDTNIPSWFLINNLLGPTNRNLFCVGDLSQSIYGFNGASPSLIKAFSEDWRGTQPRLYRLARNHRSVPAIVQLANAIQRNMTEALPLTMASHREKGDRDSVRYIRGRDPLDLANRIADEIIHSGIPLKDHCILVRTGGQVREIEGALVKARIPYVVRGAKGLLATEEVRDILAYIRIATNPKDFSAFARAAGAPKRGIGDAALERLNEVAKAQFDGDLVATAAASSKQDTRQFASTIKEIQRSTADPVLALKTALAMTNYRGYLKTKYFRDPDKLTYKLENIDRLAAMIQAIVEETSLTTEDLIFQLTLEKVQEGDENGALTISTIHSAKGLEFRSVFLFGVVESILPHFRSSSESELEEERRLFYVGVTRARDVIHLCVPDLVFKGANLVPVQPSRFLKELGFGLESHAVKC